jgi:hypothetical protein
MLANMINTHALADAQAGKWDAVASTLKAIETTAAARLCYAVESGEAAVAAGGNHTELLGVLLQDPNGIMLFQKLSSSAGVMWAHAVTVPYLQWLVSQGKMSEAVKDALIDLSAPVTRPHADVTADDCQKAWTVAETRRNVSLLSAKATAVNAWCDALDLATKSPEEVQAYCDSLLASNDGNPS